MLAHASPAFMQLIFKRHSCMNAADPYMSLLQTQLSQVAERMQAAAAGFPDFGAGPSSSAHGPAGVSVPPPPSMTVAQVGVRVMRVLCVSVPILRARVCACVCMYVHVCERVHGCVCVRVCLCGVCVS